MFKRKSKGFSLMEMMLSLGAIVALMAVIFWVFNVMSERQKVSTAIKGLGYIQQAMNKIEGSYSSVEEGRNMILGGNLLPSNMKQGNRLVNPWDGEITITDHDGTNEFYDITYYKVTEKSCPDLVGRSRPLFKSVIRKSDTKTINSDSSITDIVTFCKNSPNDGIIFSSYYEGDTVYKASVSTSVSNSISTSVSTSVSTSKSISTSVSTSVSASISASVSASTSASKSISTSKSISSSISSSISASASASKSVSTSVSISNSISASAANNIDAVMTSKSMYYVSDGGLDGVEEWYEYKTTTGTCSFEHYQYNMPATILTTLPHVNAIQMSNILSDRYYVLKTGYSWGTGKLACSSHATYCDLGDYATAGIGNMFRIPKTLTNAKVYSELNDHILGSANFPTIMNEFRRLYYNVPFSPAARVVWSCTTGERSSLALDNKNRKVIYRVGNNIVSQYGL